MVSISSIVFHSLFIVSSLCAAIEEGSVDKVKQLINEVIQKEGTVHSLDQPDTFGQFPSHYAAVFGREEIISILHEHKISSLLVFFIYIFSSFKNAL